MKKETAENILTETEQGYDFMATKFSETRKYFWRGLEFIGNYAKNGYTVLDFGCGNGRLLGLIGDKRLDYYGVDISANLIEVAKEKYGSKISESNSDTRCFSKVVASQTTLPFADDYFNTIYSIAVFHHFPSKEYREDVAKELYRITKKDGQIIITIWNLWQKRYVKNIFDNWFNKIYFIFGGSASIGEIGFSGQLDWNDCYISFTDNAGRKFQRFHHAFTKREIKSLFKKAGFKIEKCAIIDKRNILLVAKK